VVATVRAFFVLSFFALFIGALWTWQQLQQPVGTDGDTLLFVVQAGETPGHVLHKLDADGHLHYGIPLRIWVRFQNTGSMQAGQYEIARGSSARELIDKLFAGSIAQRPFALIEGWNIRQLRDALRSEVRLRQETATLSDAELMARLGRPGMHPEGRFAPDTYFFAPYSSSDLELLGWALRAQEARLAEAWSSRAAGLPYTRSDELLVMASIVEKETGQAGERAEIAGVFVRRMQIGMRLQTDPTVIYGIGAGYDGNITRADLLRPTPYNTYTIDGLPPTPIAMPGKAALDAAAHPAAGNSLYFVGRGDGSHQFSATLSEHNAAVHEYQLRRRNDYHSAPKP